MLLSDFDFDLPQDLIALRPERPRRAARLLVWEEGAISHRQVLELADILRAGDHLVFNDTRVIPAALNGFRKRPDAPEGGTTSVKINLDQAVSDECWRILAKPARRLKPGDTITFDAGLSAKVLERTGDQFILRFNCRGDRFAERLNQAGRVPLPPYIESRREVDEQDRHDYQTVFARRSGAVAAPTASLHFDGWMLDSLHKSGIGHSTVTLHVGAGTFLPIRSDDISDHEMHSEWGRVTAKAADEINSARSVGGRIIPVGTTALRLLESAATDGIVREWRGNTNLFIRPGFEFSIADGLMTNFHLPRSTLIVLVAAFLGADETRRVYRTAVKERYRFYSYGDGSLLLRK